MKRLVAGIALTAACLACSGCLAVAAFTAVGALAIANSKPADKPAGKTGADQPAPAEPARR